MRNKGFFCYAPSHVIEIYSIMGRLLYKKNIPSDAKSLIFSQNGDYLAIQLSDETHFCLQFDKVRIPFNINWRQSTYINYILNNEKNHAKYFRQDYLQLPSSTKNLRMPYSVPNETECGILKNFQLYGTS
jgi:hypothetical protein